MRTPAFTLVLCLLAAACTAPPPRPGPMPVTADMPQPRPRPGYDLYAVEPAESQIRVLVYRAGALANLGHNHVIVWHPDRGFVEAAPSIEGSSLQLRVPLAQAQVDDPAARTEEGAEFPGEIPADARLGTARNMLGEALLDAARHPLMIIRGSARSVGAGAAADLIVTLAGRDRPLHAAFALDRRGERLIVSGEFKCLQSELGLTPFSVMLGALQVQDQITVKFRISARRL